MRYQERNAVVRQDRKLLGVCSAVANTMGVNALWVRIATIALTLFVTAWTIPVYLVTAWIMARGRANRRAAHRSSSRHIGYERRYVSDADRLIAQRDTALSREIDALR
ncbi:PspC domain-containing protein [Parasphingopyxis marina]|uniref:PspC domain-containing protein n=1 Tax=Parasphingopyxis marina TaxID=2761622 RepID=A0A842HVU8_9SPHN|nr:PspC domain-containing protein [Parasphingopyxis marina]MBC2777092.1 PspC domain-containing protein [Parasphingopyxis marina]